MVRRAPSEQPEEPDATTPDIGDAGASDLMDATADASLRAAVDELEQRVGALEDTVEQLLTAWSAEPAAAPAEVPASRTVFPVASQDPAVVEAVAAAAGLPVGEIFDIKPAGDDVKVITTDARKVLIPRAAIG